MGLKIMRAGNGKPRDTWYARFTRNGQKVNVNLGVPLRGSVPTVTDASGRTVYDLAQKGDADFEKSRAAALAALQKLSAAAKTTGDSKAIKDAKDAEQAERYFRSRTGRSVKGVRLEKLATLWVNMKRSYKPSARWCDAVANWFDRFAKFADRKAAEYGGRCKTVNEITPEIASAWFEDIKANFAWETVTKQMSVLRNAYARYATTGRPNPFGDIIVRNREVGNARVSRKPLTETEVQRLFDCARDDEALYPLIVTAACTGMRCGDCFNLKWGDVDLRNGLIDCVTDKTGVKVTIPIFGRLREVLDDCNAVSGEGAKPSAFVFPSAARWYASNPDGVYQAVKPLFGKVIGGDAPEATEAIEGEAKPIAEAIEGARFTDEKRDRVIDVYKRFKAGARSCEIADALGISRSRVSMYLADAERLTGERLRPKAIATANRASRRELIERTRAARGIGKRAASLYGWHSLRATFVVLAVEAGVPLPDVQKIVGHTTSEMTMQYFNPTRKHAAERVRKQMRGTVLEAPPDTQAVVQTAEKMDTLLDGMTRDEIKSFMLKMAARI